MIITEYISNAKETKCKTGRPFYNFTLLIWQVYLAWMELESIMPSEISQTVKDKYPMISPLTKEPNQQNKQAKYNQRHWN